MNTTTQPTLTPPKPHVHHWQLWIDPVTPDVPVRVVIQCATCPARQAYVRHDERGVEHG